MSLQVQRLSDRTFIFEGDAKFKSYAAYAIGDLITVDNVSPDEPSLFKNIHYSQIQTLNADSTVDVDGAGAGVTANDVVQSLNMIVSLMLTGGGTTSGTIPSQYRFANIAARDSYFNPDRLNELLTGVEIFLESDANGDAVIQRWFADTPASSGEYDATDWHTLGIETLTRDEAQTLIGLDNINEGRYIYKVGTRFNNSALRETADRVISDKTIETPPGSISIGENAVVSNAIRALNVRDPILNRRALLLAQLYDDTGSDPAFVYSIAAISTMTINDGTGETADTAQFVVTTTNDEIIRTVRVTTNQISTTVTFDITARIQSHTGAIVYEFDGSVTTDASGVAEVELSNPIITDANFDLYLTVNCDGMTGSLVSGTFVPNSEADIQILQRLEIMTQAQAFDEPRITNFSINIPARVDLNTDLNNARTVSYDVIHSGNIQSLTLEVTTGDNKTLTVPTSDTSQTESVTLSGITTSAETTLTFRITGVDTMGASFQSNAQTVSVRNAAAHEFIYYGIGTSLDPATVDISTLQSQEVTSAGQFNVSLTSTTGANQDIIFLAPTDRDITSITNARLNINVISSFTKVADARVINSVNYNTYELDDVAESVTFSYIIVNE